MSNQRYGVFIPCYNASATIEETLTSVRKAIQKTGRNIRTYIYDDCSKDNSRHVVTEIIAHGFEGFTLVCNEKNMGERATTNTAFQRFREEFDWLFIIHADDIVKEDWLTVQIAAIEEINDPSCFTVWSSYDTFTDLASVEAGSNNGKVSHVRKDEAVIKAYITKVASSWHISGAGLHVGLYNQLDGFDVNMPQYGDTDFFVRGLLAGLTDIYIERTLTLYRVSATSVSGVSVATNRDIKEIYMLIDRFRKLLNRSEIKSMYKLISKMAFRRTLKGVVRCKPSHAAANFRQYIKAVRLMRG